MNPQRLPLVVGIAIPILVVIIVAAVVVLPRFLTKPQVDFLYATGLTQNGFNGGDTPYRDFPAAPGTTTQTREYYLVRDGRLARETQTVQLEEQRRQFSPPMQDRTEVRFYVHDVQRNESRPVSFEEASKLTLDGRQESPDGFRLDFSYGDESVFIFPFAFIDGNRGAGTWVLEGRGARHRLNVRSPASNPYARSRGVVLLGWILS